MKNVVALILAGGKSERFWPLSNKNLINFTGKNLIEYHVQNLISSGVKDFIIICSSEVAAFLRVKSKNNTNININRILQDENNHGIGRAILLAEEIIKNKYLKRPIYIINCDDVYEENLHKEVFKEFTAKNPYAILVSSEINKYKPLGFFRIDNNSIVELIEKPSIENLPSKLANMSLHLYSDTAKLMDVLREEKNKKDENDDMYERAVNKLCTLEKIINFTYKKEWLTLKYPWEVLNLSSHFLKKIKNKVSEKAVIDKWAKITPPVIIEDNVKVLEFARIIGPAVIKKNTVIGTGSMVRESIVGENCVAGYHTEITRSYIGNNCWFHSNYIGDSILGNKVNMGAGSILANLRLDEKSVSSMVKNKKVDTNRNKLGAIIGQGVQIGINASIMPGVKIGKNSVIGPNCVVYSDLEDGIGLYMNVSVIKKTRNSNLSATSRKDFRDLLKL